MQDTIHTKGWARKTFLSDHEKFFYISLSLYEFYSESALLSGKYAFFANKEYIIYRLQRKLPLKQAMNIVDTKTDFLRRGIGFGLQKHSPYKNLFNHVYVSIVLTYSYAYLEFISIQKTYCH